MHEKGSYKGFVSNKDSFLLLASAGASEAFEIQDEARGNDSFNMGREGKMSVDCNPQYAESPFHR